MTQSAGTATRLPVLLATKPPPIYKQRVEVVVGRCCRLREGQPPLSPDLVSGLHSHLPRCAVVPAVLAGTEALQVYGVWQTVLDSDLQLWHGGSRHRRLEPVSPPLLVCVLAGQDGGGAMYESAILACLLLAAMESWDQLGSGTPGGRGLRVSGCLPLLSSLRFTERPTLE